MADFVGEDIRKSGLQEYSMPRMDLRTGKKIRPKTAIKGKRYRCAKCRKRSPKPVKTPAPWYCPNCVKQIVNACSEPTRILEESAAHDRS